MTQRTKAAIFGLVLSALICGALAGCGGGDGANDEEIAKAEKRGRVYRAEKEKERRLEREIRQLQRERRQEKKRRQDQPDPAVTPTTPSSGSSSSSGRTSCGGGLEAGPATTCEFAANVRSEYEYEVGSGPGTISAYSPALNEWFVMTCTGAPHECSGAISATVYFP